MNTDEQEAMSETTSGWTCAEWEEWSNEIAALLPERYDDDAAQESIILCAVADLVSRGDALQARLTAVEAKVRDAWGIVADLLVDGEERVANRLAVVLAADGDPRFGRQDLQLAAIDAVLDDENVPPADIRAGYETALSVIRCALDDPESILNPPDRAAARGEANHA